MATKKKREQVEALSVVPNAQAVAALAKYLTGHEVAHNSVKLEVGGFSAQSARRYFMLRESLGVSGYMNEVEAFRTINRTLCEKRGV